MESSTREALASVRQSRIFADSVDIDIAARKGQTGQLQTISTFLRHHGREDIESSYGAESTS